MDELKKKRELKAERKRIQDENVKRKQAEKDAKEGKTDSKKVGFQDDDSDEELEQYNDVEIDE